VWVPLPVEPVEVDPVPEALPRRVEAQGWTAAVGSAALMTEALSAAFETWSAMWLWTT
jgi:hypothetical protein